MNGEGGQKGGQKVVPGTGYSTHIETHLGLHGPRPRGD